MVEPEFDSEIELGLEVKIPGQLPAGRADALFLYGYAFHRRQDVEGLEILVDGQPNRAVGRMPRLDLFKSLHPLIPEGEVSETHDAGSLEDPELKSFRSGFWSTVEIPATGPGKVRIEVALKLADGSISRAPSPRSRWSIRNNGFPQILRKTVGPAPGGTDRDLHGDPQPGNRAAQGSA